MYLFKEGCAPCHGDTGRGDGQQKQIDSSGYPTRPRDLTAGVYKGDPAPEAVYRRVVLGLPGSRLCPSTRTREPGASPIRSTST